MTSTTTAAIETRMCTSLNSEPLLQLAHPIARDAQLGFVPVFQPHEHAPIHGRKQLLDERHIHDRRAVDADEPSRIEPLLQFCKCDVDDVLASVCGGEGELG